MKSSHIKTYIILIIFISIIGISIAYAALSQQLQIKTTTTVQSSQTSWNIFYKTLSCEVKNGYIEIGHMIANGTTITLSEFIVKAPNSLAVCYFNIVNNGELDAKISSINGPTAVFIGSGPTKNEDETLVRENFLDLQSFARWPGNESIKKEDKVLSGEEKTVILSIGTLDSMATLPTNPVSFSITYTINFSQA